MVEGGHESEDDGLRCSGLLGEAVGEAVGRLGNKRGHKQTID